MKVVAFLLLMTTLCVVLSVSGLSCAESSTPTPETHEYDVEITGNDWNNMTSVEKQDWINASLGRIITNMGLTESDRPDTKNCVQKLNDIFYDENSQEVLVALELSTVLLATKIPATSPTPTSTPTPTPSSTPTPTPIVETYYVKEPYEVVETYYVEEPYEAEETYYEEEPLKYIVSDSNAFLGSYQQRNQIIIGGTVIQDEVVTVHYPQAIVTVWNKDVSGTFKVKFTFYELDEWLVQYHGSSDEAIKSHGEQHIAYEEVNIPSNQIKRFECGVNEINTDDNLWSWDYEVIPPTKNVEKQRTVTKNRTVEKQRTITEYRTVEKTRVVGETGST